MPHEQSYFSYFTPSQMSHEMLEAILVKRQNLAARLVGKLKQSVLTPTKHQTLLLGPRGMGKSYLVALIYHRIKALPKLAEKLRIAYFAEEEWSVASLTDLMLVILRALEREYGGLQGRIDALFRLPSGEVDRAASDLVRAFVGNRTLIILAENLEEIFRGLGKQGQWDFRAFLSERPFVTILATTPSLFAGVSEHDSAFYGFFQNIYLDELTVDEATELLEKVAHRRDDTALAAFLKTPTARERVQAVHDLAGGHPRIYLLFAHLLTQETLDELVTPFMKLLDELTPYYQSRMQLLTPQQRKIVEFLCGARGAVPVKEIAAQNLISSQTASGQLDKLEEIGYVRKTTVGRESLYELREPLLRMVIELKRGRGEPVRLIVDFLRRWYDRRERQERLSSAPSDYPMTREYLAASLDLKRAVLDPPDAERSSRFSSEYAICVETGNCDRACELAAEIIDRKGSACETEDWLRYGMCLYRTSRCPEALNAFEGAVERAPEAAVGWIGRGAVLHVLQRYSAAEASYGKALEIEPTNALAWYGHGSALSALSNHAGALTSFDKALALGHSNAVVWYMRGCTLLALSNYAAALTSFDKALEVDPAKLVESYSRVGALSRLRVIESAVNGLSRVNQFEIGGPDYWFNRALAPLGTLSLKEFARCTEQGFNGSPSPVSVFAATMRFCQALLRQKDIAPAVALIYRLYASAGTLWALGQGLTASIPAVLCGEVSQSAAEDWLGAWEAASGAVTEMDIPLRILAAAVRWKKAPGVRALLALPIEERRVLESLLPEAAVTSDTTGGK